MAASDLCVLERYLEPVALNLRQRLESANRRIKNAVFVERGIASVVAVGGDRRQAEVAVIGREGMTGLAIVLGVERWPHDTFMQVAGEGHSLTADNLRRAMAESRTLRSYLLRYAHVFSIQAGHTALANAQGKIEERLARWLLMAHDRIENDELHLTHDFLAVMLGVRRAGVTTALHELEDRALITTARGSVKVVDRSGLEDHANGLYGVPEAEFERLFKAA
jgi:CRP-like cAMP-binding protein